LKQLSSTIRMDAHSHLLTLLISKLSAFEDSRMVDLLESIKTISSLKCLDVSEFFYVLNATFEKNGFRDFIVKLSDIVFFYSSDCS
jgi:hypothetical protein